MKTLEEHNNSMANQFNMMGVPVKNNITCPECGDELWDTDNSMCLTSYPPKYAVHCDCGYKGYRN